MIVVASAIVAAIAACATVGPELLETPRSALGSIALQHVSVFAVATVTVYALCAMVMATGTLVGATLSLRRRLEHISGQRRPNRLDWTTAFASTELQCLMPSPVAEPAPRTESNDTILLRHQFSAAAARGEIARLHYLWLARTHVFSALIVLTALVGLGLAQDHGSVPVPLREIPTTSAILMLVGLILLTILGRIAIDVSTEPLIETIAQLPAEHFGTGLLRRLIEVMDAVSEGTTANLGTNSSKLQLPERLEVAIEEGQRTLVDAARHLSATTDTLGAALASSVDVLKTAIGAATAQRPPTGEQRDEAPGFAELQIAIETLTAALERLTATPDPIEPTVGTSDTIHDKPKEPNLARELRQLLREIEAAR
jgi:hypothetical protein